MAPEDRNGRRNHDEIRLLADYLSQASYLYDDNGSKAPFSGQRFVILGDLNASVYSQETRPGTLEQLFDHPLVNASFTPTSEGAKHKCTGCGRRGRTHRRLEEPSRLRIAFQMGLAGSGWRCFFGPQKGTPEHRLIASRKASSDHRLVYLDLQITD